MIRIDPHRYSLISGGGAIGFSIVFLPIAFAAMIIGSINDWDVIAGAGMFLWYFVCSAYIMFTIPATILFLGASSEESSRCFKEIKAIVWPLRLTSLIDAEQFVPKMRRRIEARLRMARGTSYAYDNIRVSGTERWEDVVKRFIHVTPIILIDAREYSSAVHFEIETLIEAKCDDKVFTIVCDDGSAPAIDKTLHGRRKVPSWSRVGLAEVCASLRSLPLDRRALEKLTAKSVHGKEKERRRAEDAKARRRTEEGIRGRTHKRLEPAATFRDVDAPWCPELAVIPSGKFMMGSSESEKDRSDNEGPQHEVNIDYCFAVGWYPVTFQEYDHFCQAVSRDMPDDRVWGRGRRPVINVSWDDAEAYVDWLAQETGHRYRLLSEAEWEYACRAGTTTRYSWGDDITPNDATYGGNIIKGLGKMFTGKTTGVGAYRPNPWGLYDMHGNVWEWCEDCWNDSYEGAPSDGSAWTSGDCGSRVLRGGSWLLVPGTLRSAFRFRYISDSRNVSIGFRVARTLSRSE